MTKNHLQEPIIADGWIIAAMIVIPSAILIGIMVLFYL
jgi:hypothetical protein